MKYDTTKTQTSGETLPSAIGAPALRAFLPNNFAEMQM